MQTPLYIFFLFTIIGNLNSSNSCISINLSATKSEGQKVLINVIIQNKTSKTISLHELIKRCDDISVNYPWELKITKEGKEYEYPQIVTGAGQLIKIKRNRSYQFSLCVDFEKLIRSENVQDITGTVTLNREYGNYDITLSYTNKEWGSVMSNHLKITYDRNH